MRTLWRWRLLVRCARTMLAYHGWTHDSFYGDVTAHLSGLEWLRAVLVLRTVVAHRTAMQHPVTALDVRHVLCMGTRYSDSLVETLESFHTIQHWYAQGLGVPVEDWLHEPQKS